MKSKLFFTLAIVAMTTFSAFKLAVDKTAAIVDQQQGLSIFISSKPVAAYDVLGSVKKGLALSGDPVEMLNSMIKKVKKEYPTADGILFTSPSMDKADAIKFKE